MNLKVISFNIRCANDENGHSIAERAPRLVKTTAPYDADVIGFQEYIPQWDEFTQKYYLENYDMFLKYRAEESSEGCPILWKKDKFECLDVLCAHDVWTCAKVYKLALTVKTYFLTLG